MPVLTKTKYQPIMHRGVPGLTFKNPDDNKGVILDGYVLFKGLNGDTKGIEPGAYANITWKAYGQYFLNQKWIKTRVRFL